MLFMGEEYGETARFQFFTSHSDPQLVEAVREGRKAEFVRFHWQQEPPDPQDEATFLGCKLNHDLKREGHHRVLRDYDKTLIRLRQSEPSLTFPDRDRLEITAWETESVLAVHYQDWTNQIYVLLHSGSEAATITADWPLGTWHKELDSADEQWRGSGSALPQRIDSPGAVPLTLARPIRWPSTKSNGDSDE